MSDKERLKVARRVLRFVDGYLARQSQSECVTDGYDFKTWAEVRQHVRLAARLGTKKEPAK